MTTRATMCSSSLTTMTQVTPCDGPKKGFHPFMIQRINARGAFGEVSRKVALGTLEQKLLIHKTDSSERSIANQVKVSKSS